MKILSDIARYLVGGLFIFSGLIKLNDPVGTAIKLEEYFDVFANDIASFFHIFIPAALFLSVLLSVLEVVLGVAVFLKYRMEITTWVLLVMILFFSFLTFYSAYFNKVTDCGCFGDAIKLTPWQSFIKDVILLGLIVLLFIKRDVFEPLLAQRKADIAIGVITVMCISVGIYAIEHLPYIDFRAYKVGANIPKQMEPSEQLRYKYIMEKNGETFEFEQYPSSSEYEFKKMVLLNPEAQPSITDYSVWNDEGEFTQDTFQGIKLLVVVHDVKKTDRESFNEINGLITKLGKDIQVMALTSSGGAAFEQFRHDVQLAVPYYFTDATVLKAMIRSNPGLMLMHEGTVVGKWHHNDVPSIADINQCILRRS